MSVKLVRAAGLSSVVALSFVGFASIAEAGDAGNSVAPVAVSEGVKVAQATPPPPAEEPKPDEESKPEDNKVERVVVTGSRLRKSEFTSSSPIQVITREESTLEGLADTTDILQGSTLAAGSQQINNTFGGFVTDGGPGANTLGLRGLDPKRTLVLVNGRRLAPAGTRGSIAAPDLNTLPESLIDRVEILKDGGSAIYGSDAIAGVVNVITRKNYDGLEVSGYTNLSEGGGAEQYQGNALWGTTFDRGSVMIAGEYYQRDALRVGDREYLSCNQDRVQNVANGQILDIIMPSTGVSKCFNMLEGVIDAFGFVDGSLGVPQGTYTGRYIPDPTAVFGTGPFAPLFPNWDDWRRVNLSYNRVIAAGGNEAAWRQNIADVPNEDPRYLSTMLISPVKRYSLFGQGSYDVFPGVEAYTELQFVRRESEQERWRQLFPFVSYLNPDNPFFGLDYARPIIQIPSNAEQTVDFYRGVMGIKGEFGSRMPIFTNWAYDLYVEHQRSEADYTGDFIYNDRVEAATDFNDTGLLCDQSLITISGGNCASLPGGKVRWFDPNVVSNGAFSPGEAAFLFGRETGHTTYSQTLVNGSVTGDVFQLPAGALAAALGFEYRTDEIDDTPGFNARNNNYWGSTTAGRTAGSDTVREVFAEANIPLLAGKSFAEDMNIDASWRYTSYDSYGEDTTYKLGLNWQVTSEYRLRGTTGTSFRAPALYEIYLANQTGFLSQLSIDPCIDWDTSGNPQLINGCGPAGLNLPAGYAGPYASALILSGGGGPGVLSAETSESRTVGFIWTPDWIDLSIAVDYWELEVDNEVGQFGAGAIVTQCMTHFPADPFCSLFTRDTNPASPTFGMISEVKDSFVNIANEATDGLDVTFRYEHEFSFGTFRLNGDLNWTFTREIRFIPDPPEGPFTEASDYNGEVYYPDYVGSLNLRFDKDDWTFFWDVDMAGRQSNDEDFGGSVFGWRGTPYAAYYKQYGEFYATHDASVRYTMDDWSLQVGVQNIFDDIAPSASSGGAFGKVGNTIGVGNPVYDVVGRRGFFRVTKEF